MRSFGEGLGEVGGMVGGTAVPNISRNISDC